MSRSRVCAAAMLLAAALATPAKSANWFEMNTGLGAPRYDAVVPLCDQFLAIWRMQRRFATKESRFWSSNLDIVQIDNIRETAFSPWADGTIPRRFCRARAQISDGVWRPIYYSIIEDGGMIGASWGVEWCVVGLDRNWANNPACRMAKP
jgi:hypothetical protein